MSFEKSAEIQNNTLKIKVSGFFNETADLGKYNFKNIKNLILDFVGLKQINSRGIMTWVRWFFEARQLNPELVIMFMNCPPVLVIQFSNIPNFIPKGTLIKSFAVPMVCESCGSGTTRMLVEGIDYIWNAKKKDYDVVVPETRCEACSVQMEPDFLPLRYFSFLQRIGPEKG